MKDEVHASIIPEDVESGAPSLSRAMETFFGKVIREKSRGIYQGTMPMVRAIWPKGPDVRES